MNYRHLFHAGNWADVVKHALLAWVLDYLTRKDKPLWLGDTHAGIGRYDLTDARALKTEEALAGVVRLLAHAEAAPADVPAAARPYLQALARENPAGGIRWYPGSPVLLRDHMRAGDRLWLNELHPDDRALLAETMGADDRLLLSGEDGYDRFKAALPPTPRRGLVLIDPPFERRDDIDRQARAITQAARRWATGLMLLWYPIKDVSPALTLVAAAAAAGVSHTQIEFLVRSPARAPGRLNGCGLVVINPPHGLAAAAAMLLDWVGDALAADGGARKVDAAVRPFGSG